MCLFPCLPVKVSGEEFLASLVFFGEGLSPNSFSDGSLSLERGDVAGRTDVVLRQRDLAFFVDDEGRSDDALDGLAVHGLLTVGAPGLEHRAVRIGQQREAATSAPECLQTPCARPNAFHQPAVAENETRATEYLE